LATDILTNLISCKILIILVFQNLFYNCVWQAGEKQRFLYRMAKKLKTTTKKNTKSKVLKEPPVILVTNDDGVTAPGIKNLVQAVKDLGKVVVVAPDKPQSGMGHAITIGQPLRLHHLRKYYIANLIFVLAALIMEPIIV